MIDGGNIEIYFSRNMRIFKINLKKIIEYGFYLFIFLLPWQTRWIWHQAYLNGGKWEYGTFSLYAVDLILIILGVLTLIIIWRTRTTPSLSLVRKGLRGGFKILVFSFLIFSFISIIWAIDKSLTFYYATRMSLGLGLFWLISKINFSFKKLSLAFVGAGAIQSFLAIYQFFNQSVFGSKWLGMAEQVASHLGVSAIEVGDTRWLRAYGSFPHPNVLAGFLVVSILLAIYLIDQYPKKIGHYLTLSLPVLLLGLLTTFSRSAFMALILGLIVYQILNKLVFKKNIITKPVLIIIFSLVVFVLVLWPFMVTRITGHARLELISRQERLKQINLTKEIIQNNLFLGTGLGNYTLTVYQKIPNFASWIYQPVHNIYLLIWSELGLIGLILWLAVLVYLAINLIKSRHKLNPEKIVSLSLLIILLTIGFFDHYLWTLNCGILLWWLVLGLVSYELRI